MSDARFRHSERYIEISLLIIAIAITLGLHLFPPSRGPLSILEFGVRDEIQGILPLESPNPEILVVDISEYSLEQVGPWPWSRARLAELVQKLIDAGARIVVLDMVLPNARDRAGDELLAKLAEQRQLVLAQVFDYVSRESRVISNSASGHTLTGLSLPQQAPVVQATGVIGNHEMLTGAPCVGNIGFSPSDDGRLRRLPEVTKWDGRFYPSLGLVALECLKIFPQEWSLERLAMTPRLLRFNIDPEQWVVLPAHQVITPGSAESPQWSGLVKNRIVIVGASAMGLADRVSTPLSSSISGVFVHAQSIHELLEGPNRFADGLLFLSPYISVGLVFFVGLALINSLSTVRITIVIGIAVLAWFAYSSTAVKFGVPAQVSAAPVGALWLLVSLVPFQWVVAHRQAQATTRLLERYVAKPVLKEILEQKNFDSLRPKRLELTVLVADMADYSKTTATQSLEDAAKITRDFLTSITSPIWHYRGTLDRYTGDGLVAFWGAPNVVQNQADQAIGAAQRMLRQVAELNRAYLTQGLPAVSLRIGIASGVALVGDFGTPFRATYTAVGNCINLAARLEAKAKELGVSVLISQSVAEQYSLGDDLDYVSSQEIRGIGTTGLYTLKS